MDPVLGVLVMFGGNYAPQSWAFCNGQLMDISQNSALFSILGTTYGGNGQTTFALPDLRGRTPIGTGQGPGLENIFLGEQAGTNFVTLTQANLPAHNHTGTIKQAVNSGSGTSDEPGGNIPAGGNGLYSSSPGSGSMGGLSAVVNPAGGNQPVDISEPYLAINFIIAIEGIYPSRN